MVSRVCWQENSQARSFVTLLSTSSGPWGEVLERLVTVFIHFKRKFARNPLPRAHKAYRRLKWNYPLNATRETTLVQLARI